MQEPANRNRLGVKSGTYWDNVSGTSSTYEVLAVVARWRANVSVFWVEPGQSWTRIPLSSTEQHDVGTLEVQHHRGPHVDTSC